MYDGGELRRRAGRPERRLDPDGGLLCRFAIGLRELRAAAGYPSYRVLASKAMFAPSVLSAAANGSSLPSLQVTLAYADACGGDTGEWRRRWEAVAGDLGRAAEGGGDAGVRRVGATPRFTPAELPPAPTCYTGREIEARRLLDLTDPRRLSRASAVVISGLVGVGKTAFALHVAQRARALYPDGQLHADFADGSGGDCSAHDVTGSLLEALGMPAPTGPRQRTGLYRSVLGGRRVLVMLDNVRHEAAVRPLLGAGTRSTVLIASRSRLIGLDNVRRITLDMLPPGESAALVSALAGPRMALDPGAADMIGDLCGYLPLALWIAATRLVGLEGWTREYVRARLVGPASPLDWLRAGDVSVRDRLCSAYHQLDPLARQAFRELSLEPNGGVAAEGLMEELADHGLLRMSPAGYRMPVLFREFAHELAGRRDACSFPEGG